MMRLRRASGIALLFLLASAATADAECAWVLWNYSSGDTSPWQAMGAWADQPKCEAEREATYARLRMGPAPPPGISTALYSQDGKNTYMGSTRYVCLPDTVDPRGPKGK
jgi:hypothetical protein